MIKLADPSPTLAEELKIEQNYFNGLILSKNNCHRAILTNNKIVRRKKYYSESCNR
jgi:hypothetical protein